jgi:RNA recognition motif-containing protein
MDNDPQQTGSTDEIIETAIVIKNIPFSYPEDDFLQKLFPQLGLVPPYAFNYHRNKVDRAFHGLAFANFQNASEAQKAVDVLNNYELERRRLRVELKKKLPAEEEQRQRLARQSRRQQLSTTATAGLGTAFGALTIGSGGGSAGIQDVGYDGAPSAMDYLDPAIRPHIVYRPTHTTPQSGRMILIIALTSRTGYE